jgi:hemerythrin-like metal-binding protein
MESILNKDKKMHWTESLRVVVKQIDDDHKRLFELVHEVHLLCQKEVDSNRLYCLISEFIVFIDYHFKREEAIMSASAYPFCKKHSALHEQLIYQVKQQFERFKKMQQTADEFVVYLLDWLIEHINESDKHISSYMVGYETNIEKALHKIGTLTKDKPCTVYLVDDDEDNVQLMHDLLDLAGLKSICYTSGIEFLQAPITNNDLVILDLNMPEKDGIEVMRDLADKQLRPVFILVSGFDERVLHSAKQLAESRKLQVVEMLCKPIDPKEFINILTKVHAECCKQASRSEVNSANFEKYESLALMTSNHVITVAELKQAIAKRELIINFQPQILFKNKQLVGAEVLVRWQHPVRGLIFPDQFIPIAEQHQLMFELTEIVILESIRAYKQFVNAGIQLTLSINLSAQNINELSFPEKLGTLLSSHNIPHEAFILELTESAILTDTSAALDIFNRLRMKDFSLSIDDFGTGDSSLKKLYQSPFSELKIDQHFVMRIEKDSNAMSIVRICTLLAKEFKMKTVAEGVETQEIWNKLKEQGCDIAQGYFIAKPMTADVFIAFCNEKKYQD